MRIGIFGKSLSVDGAIYLQQFFDKLKNVNCSLIIFKPYLEQIKNRVSIHCLTSTFNSHEELLDKADLLFSIGGDGTMLDTIAYVRNSGIPILGINLGRLGFLSSISRDEILPAIDHVMSGNYQLEQRTLLKLASPEGLFGELNYALNELSITKTDTNSLAVVGVYVNDRFLNTYWADGLIVATPTGSTAYSLSCYGPIITPGSENFVITPIASHNLTVRPIVIPDNQEIRLKVGGRNAFYQLGLDSRYQTISNTVELTIRRADFKINLIQLPQKDFFCTIREKLLWGKDQRN